MIDSIRKQYKTKGNETIGKMRRTNRNYQKTIENTRKQQKMQQKIHWKQKETKEKTIET